MPYAPCRTVFLLAHVLRVAATLANANTSRREQRREKPSTRTGFPAAFNKKYSYCIVYSDIEYVPKYDIILSLYKLR
jgi:hypothetical protein